MEDNNMSKKTAIIISIVWSYCVREEVAYSGNRPAYAERSEIAHYIPKR